MSALAGVAIWGPGVLAGVVGAGLGAFGRRRPWVMGAAGAAAVVAGLAAVVPWRGVFWPRGAVEVLALPALAVMAVSVAGARVRSVWLDRGVVAFCGWWLAASAAGRAEFWRVWFAACVVAWVLGRSGVAGRGVLTSVAPGRVAAAVLSVLGVVVVSTAPVWAGSVWVAAGLVFAAAALGMLAGGRAGAVPGVLPMVWIVGVEIGLGQAMRGRVGLVDLGCAGAVAAPWLVPRFEGLIGRLVGRRLFGMGAAVATLAVAAAVIGGAVAGAWVLRSR